MQLISKLTALTLFFAPLALAAPTENTSELTENLNNLACKSGTYRCNFYDEYNTEIQVCSEGRWVLSAKCGGRCLNDGRGLPYCA